MDTTPDSDERDGHSSSVPAVPEATVAGDWTVLAAVAAVVAGLLLWQRRRRRS